MQRLRVRWTHTSTALEGNTLTEGETLGVLQYGLTIAGKPLAHHNEVLGHSRAIDLVDDLARSGRPVTTEGLFALHAAVQTAVEVDYLKPVGSWKREPNSALVKIGGKTLINDAYASPANVPALMERWLEAFNALRQGESKPLDDFVWAHSTFARIHPFADGNGRLARLLANLPVLEKGMIPVLIPSQRRLEYIESLASWQIACGAPKPESALLPRPDLLEAFRRICADAEQESQAMLDEVLALQAARKNQ